MKRLFLGTLSIALLAAVAAPIANAQQQNQGNSQQLNQGVYGPSEATERYSPETPESSTNMQRRDSIMMQQESQQMDENMGVDSPYGPSEATERYSPDTPEAAGVEDDNELDADTQFQSPERLTYDPRVSTGGYYATPFETAYLAYFGYFEDQGIPSYGRLIYNFTERDISGEDIVQAAIDSGRLPAAALDDMAYVDSVETLLQRMDVWTSN